METVCSIDEYHRLIYETKVRCKPTFTNASWPEEYVARIISQGRLYSEVYKGGIILYDDEGCYYDLTYYWNVGNSFPEILSNKPCAIKNVYRDDDMPYEMKVMESMLKDTGFLLDRKLHMIECKEPSLNERILGLYEFSNKIIDQNDITIGPLHSDMIEEFNRLRYSIPGIRYYEIPYFTDNELLEQSKNTDLMIAFCTPANEICGYSQIYNMGSYTCGAIAIKKEYLEIGGLALALSAKAYERDRLRTQHRIGWIGDDNKASIRYHKKMGWRFINKCMNEWIKEEMNQ